MKQVSLKALSVLAATAFLAAPALAQTDTFNLAAGQAVEASRAPADAYPDPDGLKLTDGSFEFSWDDMVGFEGPEAVQLVVDLGATYDYISYAAVKVMRSDGSDVAVPNVIVSSSEDGLLWEDLGMADAVLEGEIGNDTVGTLIWSDEEWAGYGQFVRFELLPTGAGWTMVAEVQAGNGPVPADLLPEPVETAEPTEEAVNVAMGQSYTIEPEASEAYPDEGGIQLTDGSYEYAWGDMVGIADPVDNPVVVVDLGEQVDGITRVAGLFMRSFASGVNLPYSIIVSVSEDGEDFEVVGLAARTEPAPPMNELINSVYWQDLANPVSARYVKLDIRPRTGWLMISEVVIQTGNAVPEVVEEEAEEEAGG